MKLEQQVVSLELAKRLKQVGVKQESFFEWQKWTTEGSRKIEWKLHEGYGDFPRDWYSAFTVAELGEMLPEDIYVDGVNYQLQFTNGIHSVGYQEEIDVSVFKVIHESIGLTEADARAKMLIYLLENKFITL